MPQVKNPKDTILLLSIIVVSVACVKFLLAGVTISANGHTLDFGQVDSLAYSSLLAPILGVHGYVAVRKPKKPIEVDNPDAN